MDEGGVEELVGPLDAALDRLLDADLTRVSSTETTALLRRLESARRRFTGVDHRVLSEVDQRGVAGDYARSSTAELLTTMLRVAPGEARARVVQARETQSTVLPSGERVPAVLPRCADAVAAGDISAGHVSVIAKTIARLPAGIAFEAAPVAEAMLVEAARHQHPQALAQTGALLLARLDPDGSLPSEEDFERRRGFSLHRRSDGAFRPGGEWTPELTALWAPILDVLAAPAPAVNGAPDERSAAQRRHDAMAEAAQRLLRSGDLPSANGVPVTVLVRMDADSITTDYQTGEHQTGDRTTGDHPTGDGRTGDHPTDDNPTGDRTTGDHPTDDHPTGSDGLIGGGAVGGEWPGSDMPTDAAATDAAKTADAATADTDGAGSCVGSVGAGGFGAGPLARVSGVAQTSTGELWPFARLRVNLGDAAIVPIVIDRNGAALMCGRTTRLATRAQRLALAARDGGCVFPQCARPAAWCQAHHVIDWLLGGPTDITNLCLLCRFHHREFERKGWAVRMAADGLPEWLPPPWIDPDQRPVRNTVHHLHDLDFRLDHDVGRAG